MGRQGKKRFGRDRERMESEETLNCYWNIKHK